MTTRVPYVGEGADGCRRSAWIDRSQAEGLPTGPHQEGWTPTTHDSYGALIESAEAWERQAAAIEAQEREILVADIREHGTRILEHESANVIASLYAHDGRALLWWTDGVVNEWFEAYDEVPVALVRFALLIAADADEDGEGGRFFLQSDPAGFEAAWAAVVPTFLDTP